MFPRFMKTAALGLVLSVTLAGGVMANPIGTPAGTDVTNTISLSYNTGAGENIALVAPPSVTFRVDRKIDLLLDAVMLNAETPVIPGTVNAVLAFSLRNLGNGTQGFILNVARAGDLGLSPSATATKTPGENQYWLAYGTTDQFSNATEITSFVVGGASGLIGDIASGGTGYVFIVANVDETKINALQDTFTLTATATNAGTTTPVVESRSANREVENVILADALSVSSLAGSTVPLTNVALDGKDADQGRFVVTAPVLTATKTVAVIDEDMPASTYDCAAGSGTAVVNATSPAYLPGGCIAYTITVSNAAGDGAVAASNITITDVLPANVTFAAIVSGAFMTERNGQTVSATLATLPAGQSASFTIRATIN